MLPIVKVYYVELSMNVKAEDDLEKVIDPLLAAFEQVKGVEDVDLALNLETTELVISLYIPADSQPTALATALAATRTAIHTTGGFTPNWEDESEPDDFRSTVRLADLTPC